jgi:hypothetical protein
MPLLESAFVTLIVSACTVISIWGLISLRLRLKVLQLLSVLPQNAGGSFVVHLRQKTITQLAGSGCGTCSRAANVVNATLQHANRRPAAPRR